MKKVTSILMAFVLMLTLIPTAWAEGESVGTGAGVAMIGDATYETLADAVAKADNGATIKLLKDTAEDITILAGKTITIDLNGKKITNKSADTITVERGAALTINGTGTVDNVTHGKAAIVNGGTVVLNGGLYTRSKEDMENNKDTGGKNSYYTILNDNGGVMTINAGVEVKNIGHFSSMIRNGGTTASTLTINGGTFSGGINTVKNDGAGTLTINGGDFSNTTQFVVMNWHKATINGGSFKAQPTAEAVLFTSAYGKDAEVLGELTINNGNFECANKTQSLIQDYYDKDNTGTATFTGGTFNTNPKDYVPTTGYTVAKKGDVYTVSAKDKNKDGTVAETSAVKLEVSSTSGDAAINTTVNKNDIETNKELTVTNNKTAVTINQTGVAAIVGTGAALNLSIKADSKTPESANTAAYNKAIAGKDANSAVVVNISLTSGTSKVFATDVTGAYALVTVPYSTDKADKLTVYYLNGSDATALTKVTDAAAPGAALNTFSYDATNKLITLKLPHFSEYLISTTATRSVVHHYGGSGTTTTTGTKTKSPTTFDAGVGIYAVSAILSVTGMAWVGTKQRKH